jgi:ABC-type multidrug transport system ATPase subunit/pSer/pThr/pTyr-binding forkhead associated (FHA) protein
MVNADDHRRGWAGRGLRTAMAATKRATPPISPLSWWRLSIHTATTRSLKGNADDHSALLVARLDGKFRQFLSSARSGSRPPLSHRSRLISADEPALGRLTVYRPEGERSEHELVGDLATLGRAEDNTVILPDLAVSRHHAQIARRDGAVVVMDLGSLNGTLVNGVRLAARQPFALRGGDRLDIGPFSLRYTTAAATSAPEDADDPRQTLPLPRRQSAGRLSNAEEARQSSSGTVGVAPGSSPRLLVWVGGKSTVHALEPGVTTLGRSLDNTIVIPDPTVSRRHAEIRSTPEGWLLVDLGSGNGIYHHGQRIDEKVLQDNDAFRIGETTQIIFQAAPAPVPPLDEAHPPVDLAGREVVTVGRDRANDVVLSHPQVSRVHAKLERRGEAFVLVDLGSTNGTFVNGRPVATKTLKDGDTIQIGPYSLALTDGKLASVTPVGRVRIDAIALTRTVGRGVRILQPVYLTIKPREFVAVVGPSGSGKSTLVDALCGFRPATSGRVLYNGIDLSDAFDAFRTSIGYVPQEDIIHRDLPLRQALRYAAELRLPRDTTPAEREARIDEVLQDLGLEDQQFTRIGRLSGGQRKRASIGVELLTKPNLFFLDEPTSGLDPSTETRMMRLLRELADQGRTLVLITHATQNILLCDKVVILANGGYVAFFGTPYEALDFFGVQDFVDIYEALDREPAPGWYAERYRVSPYAQLHLGEVVALDPDDLAGAARRRPRPADHGVSGLRQFGILTRRSLELLGRNPWALALLLLQAPVIALLIGVLYNRAVFSERPLLVPSEQLIAARVPPPLSPLDWPPNCGLSEDAIAALPEALRSDDLQQPCGNVHHGMNVLFLVAVVAIWLGVSNAAKEIVKELPIYRRERMVTLKIGPYLASKLVVLVGIAAIQTLLLLGIVASLITLPAPSIETPLGLVVTVFLTFVAATSLGLFISALVSTNDEAGNLVPIVLIPQIIFAGAIFPVREMGEAARVVANATLSKWSWEALGAIVAIPRIARAQGGQSLGVLDESKWGRTFDVAVPHNLAMLALFAVLLLVAASFALKRKDSL